MQLLTIQKEEQTLRNHANFTQRLLAKTTNIFRAKHWKKQTKESPEQPWKGFSCKHTLILRTQAPAGSREASQRERHAHRGRPLPPPETSFQARGAQRHPGSGHNPSKQSSEEAAAAPGRQPQLSPAARLVPGPLPDGGGSTRISCIDAGARPRRAKAGDLPPGTQARLQPRDAELLRPRPAAAPEEPSAPPSASPFRGAPRIGSARPVPSRTASASRCATLGSLTNSDSLAGAGTAALTGQGAGTGPAAGAEGAAAATYRLQPAPREGTDSPPVRTRRAQTAAHDPARRRRTKPPPLSPARGRRACGLGSLTCSRDRAAPARPREGGWGAAGAARWLKKRGEER